MCLYESEDVADSSEVNVARNDVILEDLKNSKQRCSDIRPHKKLRMSSKCLPNTLRKPSSFVKTDPSYLRTLGQTHSGWIFGAIAELIDNSRDAKAARYVNCFCKVSDFVFVSTFSFFFPMLFRPFLRLPVK